MNVNDLIGANPQLLQDLVDVGFSYAQVDDLGLLVSAQLSERSPTELGDLLGKLNSQSFLMCLDVRALADKLGSDMPTMQSALLMLASAITLFEGNVEDTKPSAIE